MKKKYRILEKRYSDGSVWYFPQIGDWWHGWRYICTRHTCPYIGPNTTKEVFKYFKIDELVGVKDDESFVLESDSDIDGFAIVPGHLD